MPCALLEKYVSFLPEAYAYDDLIVAAKELRTRAAAEPHDNARTRRRVQNAAHLFFEMLYMGDVRRLVNEILKKGANTFSREEMPLTLAESDEWLKHGAKLLRAITVEHTEFMLKDAQVRRGAEQLAENRRALMRAEIEAICDAIRVVQQYLGAPTCAHAGQVGQQLYNMCGERGGLRFAVHRGQILSELP